MTAREPHTSQVAWGLHVSVSVVRSGVVLYDLPVLPQSETSCSNAALLIAASAAAAEQYGFSCTESGSRLWRMRSVEAIKGERGAGSFMFNRTQIHSKTSFTILSATQAFVLGPAR